MSHQSDLISSDILEYLKQHENKELLRFLTCGSVDDGKSTLIGRLLHDSKMIYEDQLAALQNDNSRVGNAGEELDLALLVDGLQAEREQGITIDVAYRYFSTDKRKFIIADTPGHEQYTRNMATGASTCDLAIILIDARHGVQVQTKRHSFIVSQLGLKHTIIAVNKMDLVEFSEERFEQIKKDYLEFAKSLDLPNVQFVPLSALKGDNVVNLSPSMEWYKGKPLMQILETVPVTNTYNFDELRFPVQYVNRPNLDFRGYCGTLTSGVVRKGDSVTVLPSGKSSKVKSIVTFDGEIEEAFPPMSVTLTLEDEIDISRGDILVHSDKVPSTTKRFDASLVWMSENNLIQGKEYEIKFLTSRVPGAVTAIRHQIDVNTLETSPAAKLSLNEIARCEFTLQRPIIADNYKSFRGTGSFIVVDRLTNATMGAGMIIETAEQQSVSLFDQSQVSTQERATRFGQKAAIVKITGEESDTLIYSLEKALFDQGRAVVALNQENSDAANALKSAGLVVITSADVSADIELSTEGNVSVERVKQVIRDLQEQDLV